MVTYVIGRPGTGKTTYVADHRATNDLVLDFDALAHALGSDTQDHHETGHPQLIRDVVRTIWRPLADTITRQGTRHDVWIIHATPTLRTRDHYATVGRIVDMDAA